MCMNMVTYYRPKGWDYVETQTRCGNTDYFGNRAICDECATDRVKMGTIARQERLVAEDNATARACGWGEF